MDDEQINSLVEHSRAQMVEISSLFFAMPFSGACDFHYWTSTPRSADQVFGLDDIIHNLKELKTLLEGHVEEDRVAERELTRYKTAVRGLKLLTELMNDVR